MKKKVIIIVSAIILLIALIGIIVFTVINSKVEIIKKSFTFEYGEVVDIKVKDILKTQNKKISSSAKLDLSKILYDEDKVYPKVGKYKVRLSYQRLFQTFTENVIVTIKDTTPPEFTKVRDEFVLTAGSEKLDYLSFFEVFDLSEVVVTYDDSQVKYNVVGEYTLVVTVTDIYENSVSHEVKIIINPKPPVTPRTSNTPQPTILYVEGILVVNKKHPLPSNYAPGENPVAAAAIRLLIADMQRLGFNVCSSYSGYRSFSSQRSIYDDWVRRSGRERADTFVARPGHSEHQTGLAFDLRHSNNGGLVQPGTKEAIWIAENAHLYGFIVRYPAGKEHITGYIHEPWHLRYIGDRATSIFNSGKTLEEYLGVEGGDYR